MKQTKYRIIKNKLLKSVIPSPVNDLTIITSPKGLCFVEYEKNNQNELLQKKIKRYYPDYHLEDGYNEFSHLTQKWITTYFNDHCDPGINIPLDIRGTDFETKTWQIISTIPFGTTMSYKEIAETAGIPKSARAVGGATGKNPISIIIPCHRVIGSNGTLTGYGGGLDRKRYLLELESILFPG